MKKLIILLLLLVGVASADSPTTSGLKIGEKTPAHNPIHVTGPDAGSTICPV